MRSAVFLLVVCALLWSTGGICIKLISWNSLGIAGMRSAFALPLLLFMLWKQRLPFKIHLSYIYTGLFYALTVVCFVSATKITTAANAIVLQYTAPVYVIIFSGIILREKVKLIDITAIAIAFMGITMFFFDKLSYGVLAGNILALISGVTFAFLTIFLRMQKDINPLISIIFGNIFTVLICLYFMFQSMPTFCGWAGLAYMGVFQIGLSYLLFTIAIKKVTALQGIMIPLMEPVFNPIWVFIFYGEAPGKWSILGCIVVFMAIFIRSVTIIKNSTRRFSCRT